MILLCLAAGAGYAALLYSAKAPWSRGLNYGLAALRFGVVSFLCFLLLSPFLKTTTNTTEKPTLVLALDNSQSVDRKSTRLNSSHSTLSRMPSSA